MNNQIKPVAYLKYNSMTSYYSPWCLQHWLNIFAVLDYNCYIICDNKKLQKKIENMVNFDKSHVKFIKSKRTIPRKIMQTVCTPNWKNAAFAHLTTFYHAKKHGIKEFWNIDADDTSFMHNHVTVAQSLEKVEQHARNDNIDLFSLDMHRTRYYGKHWTFGITFTRMQANWESLLLATHGTKWREEFASFHEGGVYNVDSYFAYLKNHNYAHIETFNIENMYFIHWGGASLVNFYRAIQIERQGMMYFPIGQKVFNESEFSVLKTADDVINIDASISEQQSYAFMDDVIFHFIRLNAPHCKSLGAIK